MDGGFTNDWRINAKELWEKGITFFPIEESLVKPARTGFKDFLKRRDEKKDHSDWSLCRPGEAERDLGLIQRIGGKYDVKSFFHQDGSLFDRLQQGLLTDPKDVNFLSANLHLLHAVNFAGGNLTKVLDNIYGIDCHTDYMQCQRFANPYCATTLRSLFYPDSPTQTGAQAHIDRSFLTIHLGDEGGNLQMLIDDQWQNISPPAGYAVAFFGVKVLWVTNGLKQPLRHRSVTFPGFDRFAFVHFGHVSVGDYLVTNAQTALEYWQSQPAA